MILFWPKSFRRNYVGWALSTLQLVVAIDYQVNTAWACWVSKYSRTA